MGFDKATIDFHGKPQYQYLGELLRKFCVRVFISLKESSNTVPAIANLKDKFQIESPLNGILSALNDYPDNAWLTVPVDMPAINEPILQFLIDHRDPSS